jgi:hypothetical protein
MVDISNKVGCGISRWHTFIFAYEEIVAHVRDIFSLVVSNNTIWTTTLETQTTNNLFTAKPKA